MKKKIWFDLVTAPDIPFFSSIINEIKENYTYFEVIITARKHLEIPELVSKYQLPNVYFIDVFYGKKKLGKILSFFLRTILLIKFALFKKIDLGFSFASRSHTMACFILGIKNGTMYDYEKGKIKMLNKLSNFVLVPPQISDHFLQSKSLKLHKRINYPELKESLYAYDFIPNKDEIIDQGISLDKIIIVLRMSSVYAHYHDHFSQTLDMDIIHYLANQENIALVVLPRYKHQFQKIKELINMYPNIYLLTKHISGQNLIWHSDGIISGGGSMIREAVCLQVPSYDIFTGSMAVVEEELINSGKVIKINSKNDFNKILLKKIPLSSKKRLNSNILCKFLVNELEKQIKSI